MIDRMTAGDPAHQAFLLLRTVFTVAPILFGLDKFVNLMTDWPTHLAPFPTPLKPLPTPLPNQCTPNTINCALTSTPNKKHITNTAVGHADHATAIKNTISDVADTNVHRAGRREERQKKK